MGSNLGDRLSNCQQALSLVADQCGQILKCASFYETAPIGAADQTFVNTAFLCQTSLTPSQFLTHLLDIEHQLGRQRLIHWGNRSIDLDIILWKNTDGQMLMVDRSELRIPHPACLERDFVMVPATEIAPTWVHPKTGQQLIFESQARGYHLSHKLNAQLG